MSFYHSAELRWFSRERLATEISTEEWLSREHSRVGAAQRYLDWFCNGLPRNNEDQYSEEEAAIPSVRREKERTDHYLLIPDCDKTGIKLRQGNLEVKALVSNPRPYRLPVAGGGSGHIDQWVKWSFSDKNGDVVPKLQSTDVWRQVKKLRYLQKYSFDHTSLKSVSPNVRPDTGCNIELTMVVVDSDAWITFGFEAFGPSGKVMGYLDRAVSHFFAQQGKPPESLEGRDSLNYPAWLVSNYFRGE